MATYSARAYFRVNPVSKLVLDLYIRGFLQPIGSFPQSLLGIVEAVRQAQIYGANTVDHNFTIVIN
jgi:hypothetical protein